MLGQIFDKIQFFRRRADKILQLLKNNSLIQIHEIWENISPAQNLNII